MNDFALDTGRRIFCQTLGTDKVNHGVLEIKGGDIRLSLFQLNDPIELSIPNAINLLIENGWTATLLDNVPFRPGYHHGPKFVFHNYQLISNTMLVGRDQWLPTDRVRRIFFRLPGFEPVLRTSKVYASVRRDVDPSEGDQLLFEVRLPDAIVRSWCSATWVGMSENAENIVPWIEIQFTESRSLDQARAYMARVSRFFALSGSRYLLPTEVKVSRYSESEFIERVSANLLTTDHRLYHYYPERHTKYGEVKAYASVCSFFSDEERLSTERLLAAWLSRDSSWISAEALQMQSLDERKVMGPSRLLSCSRWFEEIPGTKAGSAISDDHRKALGKIIERSAQILGYKSLRGRFSHAIANIAKETNRERYLRLVSKVDKLFGDQLLAADVIEWLAEAAKIRNVIAHGAYQHESDIEHEIFFKSTHALECFCTLLMLADLPLSPNQLRRIGSQESIEEYIAGIKGTTPKSLRSGAKIS